MVRKTVMKVTFDLIVAAIIILTLWVYNYKIPRAGIKEVNFQNYLAQHDMGENRDVWQGSTEAGQGSGESGGSQEQIGQTVGTTEQKQDKSCPDGLQRTKIKKDSKDWHKKFADKFSDKVEVTDTIYKSPDLSIELSFHQYDSGILDKTSSGRHLQYGTNISYVVADIYIGDITCLQTAFAQDTYGIGYTEKLTDMSKRLNAAFAINGDSYSNNQHQNNGTIIRNGVIYRDKPTDAETCVLNWDGTIDIYQPDEIDTQTLIDKGAYQSWIFGPSLLDKNGKAKDKFLTWDYIRESHPRTAIGYYEPGHYCILLVDGRQQASRGMFLDEMAAVFENLGCKQAYNLDGGHCSFMTMQSQVVNHPYKPEHEIEDAIMLMDGVK